jgi:hypothetical protein
VHQTRLQALHFMFCAYHHLQSRHVLSGTTQERSSQSYPATGKTPAVFTILQATGPQETQEMVEFLPALLHRKPGQRVWKTRFPKKDRRSSCRA